MREGLPKVSDHSSPIASEQLEGEKSLANRSGFRSNLPTTPPSNRIASSHLSFRSPEIENKILKGEGDDNALHNPGVTEVRGSDNEATPRKSISSSSVRVAPPLWQMSKTPSDPDAVKTMQKGLAVKPYTPNSRQSDRTAAEGHTLSSLPSSSHTASKNSSAAGVHPFHADFNSSLLAKHKRFLLQSRTERQPSTSDRGSLHSSSRNIREKQFCTEAEKGSTSSHPFYRVTGHDRNKVTSSPQRSFPPPPPKFSLHHPHGFRLLKSSSVVDRSLRHYFRLPEAPSDALNGERRCIQEQLLYLEKAEKEGRRRIIQHRNGDSSHHHTYGENDGGIVLDGFLLLSASSCESPDEVKVVSLQCSQLEQTIPEDLVYFQNLSFLDVSENKLLLEDLLLLGGVRTLHLAYNHISSLEALHRVVQWQLEHRKSILEESLSPSHDSTVADTEETSVSRTTGNGVHPTKETEDCIDAKNDERSFEILLPCLTALNLSYNRIPSSHICFLTHFPALHQLDLSGNNLRFLPKDMSCLASVSHLALECNNFTIVSTSAVSAASTSFSGDATGLFQSLSTMPSLLEVNLNRNHIECIPPLSPLPESSFFFSRLKVVGLARNPIKKVEDILPLVSLHPTLRRLALFETPLSIDPKESTQAQFVVDNMVEALFKAKMVEDARAAAKRKGKQNEWRKKVPDKKCQPCNSSSPQSTEVEDDLWANDTWSRLVPLSNDPLPSSSSFPMNSSATLPPTQSDGTNNDIHSEGDTICDGEESETSQFHKNVEEGSIARANLGVRSESGKLDVRKAAVAAAVAARKTEADRMPAYGEKFLFSEGDACPKADPSDASSLFVEHPQREPHSDSRFSYSPISGSAQFVALMNHYFARRTGRTEGNTPLFSTSKYQQLHFGENVGSAKQSRRRKDENTACLSCANGLFSPSRLTEYIQSNRIELVLQGNHLEKKSTGKFLSEHRGRGQEDFHPMIIPGYEEFMNIYVLEGGKRARWKKQQARRKREGLRPPSPLILVKPEPTSTPPSCEEDTREMPAEKPEEASRRTTFPPEQEAKALPLCCTTPPLKASSPPPPCSDDHVFLTALDGGGWGEAKIQEEEMRKAAEGIAESSVRGASVGPSGSNWPPEECGNHTTIQPSGSSQRVAPQPLSSPPPVIPTNVHTAMKELRSLLRKPLPSLPCGALHYSSKTKK